ncbi:MAG: hypothetical protein J6B40_01110, partial [Oscillospiraceae bacterium]|nr:hypothetical protein [Oscillospiraceae bacterium]
TAQLTPAITALSERLGTATTTADVGWGSAGIAFAWPGLAFTLIAVLVLNAILVVLGVVKTMWTDIWSLWHGQVLGGFVWAATGGNVTLGVIAATLYLTIGSFIADYTAKDYQEFNGLPGISVPCTVTFLALFAKPINKLFEAIPGINKINLAPDVIKKKMGVFGELGVMGAVIGIVIGILGGLPYNSCLGLGVQMGLVMVLLPKTVSVLCEGAIPIANSITEFIQDHFGEKKAVYVGVDCAALLGHPSVMASAVLLYPLAVILGILLPGNALIPIASLAIIPYWCGAIAPYFKGNVFRMVVFMMLWMIPVFYIASVMGPVHTLTMGNLGLADPAVLNSSFDMGGDILGFAMVKLFGLFA